jgi:Tfp pilus assembly protein PilF
MRGTVAQLRGDLTAAAASFRDALATGSNQQWALRNLGYLALEAGQPGEAAAHFREALALTWTPRNGSVVLENLNAFASAARAQRQWERAARLLGAVDAGLERLGGVLAEPLGQQQQERTLAAARAQLGEPAFTTAYAAGRALSLEQAVQEALATE